MIKLFQTLAEWLSVVTAIPFQMSGYVTVLAIPCAHQTIAKGWVSDDFDWQVWLVEVFVINKLELLVEQLEHLPFIETTSTSRGRSFFNASSHECRIRSSIFHDWWYQYIKVGSRIILSTLNGKIWWLYQSNDSWRSEYSEEDLHRFTVIGRPVTDNFCLPRKQGTDLYATSFLLFERRPSESKTGVRSNLEFFGRELSWETAFSYLQHEWLMIWTVLLLFYLPNIVHLEIYLYCISYYVKNINMSKCYKFRRNQYYYDGNIGI